MHLPSQSQQIYDVTGAGDTVIAMLAAGLAVGQSLPEATMIANVAAGLAVAKLGTATVQLNELQSVIEHSAEYHNIIHHQLKRYKYKYKKSIYFKHIVILLQKNII